MTFCNRYDLYEVEVKCSKNITRSDGVFGAPNGYVYIELQMDEELSEGGRTVRYFTFPVYSTCSNMYMDYSS